MKNATVEALASVSNCRLCGKNRAVLSIWMQATKFESQNVMFDICQQCIRDLMNLAIPAAGELDVEPL